MSRDFEIVQSGRSTPVAHQGDVTILPPSQNSRVGDAIADNFGKILDLASNIAEIEKMKVQSAAVLRQMEESRKNLIVEAEAYATTKNADTDSVIRKMQIVRDMMRDFYENNNNANLSGEDFSRIISSIISEIGRL